MGVVPGVAEDPEVVAAFLLVVVTGGAEGFEMANFGLDVVGFQVGVHPLLVGLEVAVDRLASGERWQETGLVFTTSIGTTMAAGNVRRDFRRALALVPGIDPSEWTPRELRHSFVSVLSDAGVPVEEISRLVGNSGTTVTELVYRHQLKPVIQTGAVVMDRFFGRRPQGA